ncbi:hypothetical protein GP486_000109 [Trichoglossum hirsutum]|uniref:Mitochondrial division protein 1 n=1 Tax=Trichoglossum hirsutum TaxID=265104 RepID=A0A9P8RTZ7_9PEZI|nr:hypothetical protein GP486_000109 [Trichoglossum hirsutum]
MEPDPDLDPEHYTVAWIAPLEIEALAAWYMLDHEHQGNFSTGRGDDYVYTAGDINGHNVIIATFPAGQDYGVGSAAALAGQVKKNFPNLWFGLLVGVAAGLPNLSRMPPRDIRLGDVLVGLGEGESAGLVNYGLGKETVDGFKPLRQGVQPKTETIVRAAIGNIKTYAPVHGNVFLKYYESIKNKPHSSGTFADPGQEKDQFYQTVNRMDSPVIVERPLRSPSERTKVWYGPIGSGDRLMKNALKRDELRDTFDLIGLEMEAAGTMDTIPVGVVRGVCDYGDDRKNKEWQPYAAAMAAAYAKALLYKIKPPKNRREEALQARGAAPDTEKVSEAHKVTHEDQNRLLTELPHAVGATVDSKSRDHEPSCLLHTRADLLCQIRGWAADADDKCIFWLNGMAGTGKSTIARTVAREFRDQNCLGASFFFSRGGGDLSSAHRFFSTLAIQLANTSPIIKRYICEAIAKDSDVAQQGLSNQWRRLIFQPLSRLNGGQSQCSTLVLVIDALDECESQDDVQLILQLLTEAKELKTTHLRVLITSRPELPIRLRFRDISSTIHQDFILHDISKSIVDQDISDFLKYELGRVRKEHNLVTGWPSDQSIKCLVDRASGLFIYAATICRFIRSSRFPEQRLTLITQGSDVKQEPERNLDEIYTQILRDSVIGDSDEQDRAELVERFQQIVGPIVVSFDILSVDTLGELLSVGWREIDAVLRHLHSVLDVPVKRDSSIKLLHPSFRDFLLDKRRCQDTQFWIDEKRAHRNLYTRCMLLMSSSLKRDICDLKSPGEPASKVKSITLAQRLPSHIQYACRYWVEHFRLQNSTQIESGTLGDGQILKFFRESFLHWLEALSLMGKTLEGILAIRNLESMLPQGSSYITTTEADEKRSPGRFRKLLGKLRSDGPAEPRPQSHYMTSDLRDRIQDAKRFILYNRSAIERAPLQVYTSALLFSPKMSLTRQQYLGRGPTWIDRWPLTEERWSPSLQTLEGHFHPVVAVAFSQDGRFLASSSSNDEVGSWDVKTGALRHMFRGNRNSVNTAVFSHDSQLLASASIDRRVKIRDAKSGALQCTLESSSNRISAIAFSQDGQLLALGSARTIEFWDVKTGALQHTLEDPLSFYGPIALSPDGQLLASASSGKAVKLWDVKTGTLRRALKSHIGLVSAMTFSPDGHILALGSSDGDIEFLDTKAGSLRPALRGHSELVQTLAFSRDGQLLASGSADYTVRLWDVKTRALKCTLGGHSTTILAVTFSPDGCFLASGSRGRTIKLWDVEICTLKRMLKGPFREVAAVTFSPDGQLFASTSNETIRFWDVNTGALRRTLKGHNSRVLGVISFSPDGQLFASAFHETVKLWDVKTGALRCALKVHPSSRIITVSLSLDGQHLALGCSSGTVLLFKVKSGALRRTLEGHSGWIGAIAFSQDGQHLASGSADETIKFWDVKTGALRRTLESHSRRIVSLMFAPNGQLLASASPKTVKLWDMNTGTLRHTIHVSWALILSCSNDGSHIVTDGGSIKLTITSSDPVQPVSWSWLGYSLRGDKSWVMWNGRNVLWLPPEYRSACVMIRGNTIAMGYTDGRVTSIQFSPDISPIPEEALTLL